MSLIESHLRLMPSLMHLELKAGSGMAVINKLLSELTPPSIWQLANYLVPKLEVIGLCPNQCIGDTYARTGFSAEKAAT